MAMNKGEWSELYAILHMLSEPDLTIVDDNLEEITNELYSVKNLSVKEQENIIKYVLENNMDVQVYFLMMTSNNLSQKKKYPLIKNLYLMESFIL